MRVVYYRLSDGELPIFGCHHPVRAWKARTGWVGRRPTKRGRNFFVSIGENRLYRFKRTLRERVRLLGRKDGTLCVVLRNEPGELGYIQWGVFYSSDSTTLDSNTPEWLARYPFLPTEI